MGERVYDSLLGPNDGRPRDHVKGAEPKTVQFVGTFITTERILDLDEGRGVIIPNAGSSLSSKRETPQQH